MRHAWPLFVAAVIAISGCTSGSMHVKDILADERFLSVTSAPHAFDGQLVAVKAWITLRHEDKNLWATWADHEKWDTTRCISLIGYDSLIELESKFDGHYVEVTGVIVDDASRGGTVIRLGACSDVAIEISGPSAIRIEH